MLRWAGTDYLAYFEAVPVIKRHRHEQTLRSCAPLVLHHTREQGSAASISVPQWPDGTGVHQLPRLSVLVLRSACIHAQ